MASRLWGLQHLLAVNVVDIPLVPLVQNIPAPLGGRKLVHPPPSDLAPAPQS